MPSPHRTDPTATHAPPDDPGRTDRTLSRRTLVTAAGATALTSLAGCSAVVDSVADRALGDVTVVNGSENPISGTIEVVDPDDEDVLGEPFDLDGSTDDGDVDADADSVARYDDVWTDAGEYGVSIDLDEEELDDADVGAEDADTVVNDTETVTIDDPDAERLAIGIAQEGPAGLIGFRVIEGGSDLEDVFE